MAFTVSVPLVLWFTPIVQPMKPARAWAYIHAVLTICSGERPVISATRSGV
jgi:hypothetical protein